MNLVNDVDVTNDLTIRFTWGLSPHDGGTPVLYYNVYYDQGLGNDVYTKLVDGSTVLEYQTNFYLTPGLFYSFYVTAVNSAGESLPSVVLPILAAKLPDAPVNIRNNPATTTAWQIGVSWDQGEYNGGFPIADYRIRFRITGSEDDFVVFIDDEVEQTTIVTGLSPSIYYDFIVEARNLIGYSPLSEVKSILAAQIPDAPTDLANVVDLTTAT